MPPSRRLNSPKSNAESTIEYLQLPNYSINVHKKPHLNETKTRTRKKCTAHGLAMMSFVSPLLRGGQIGVATSDEGPLSHETRLKSALGLRSTNAKKDSNLSLRRSANLFCVCVKFFLKGISRQRNLRKKTLLLVGVL